MRHRGTFARGIWTGIGTRVWYLQEPYLQMSTNYVCTDTAGGRTTYKPECWVQKLPFLDKSGQLPSIPHAHLPVR